jgi:homocysteine S-methyltransferase
MGTELARRGIDTGLPLWSANALLSAPVVVEQIHRDYIAAGAQVITTDTFRTNIRTLARAGMLERARELTFKAVELARRARVLARAEPDETDASQQPSQGVAHRGRVMIAGSIAPVEDCYSPELVPYDESVLLAEHTELARNLADAGCDLLLIETMNTVCEATAAARAAAATGLPTWVSFMLGPDNRLLSGEALDVAVRAVLAFRPRALLLNCLPVAQVNSALDALRDAINAAHHSPSAIKIGVYANAGHVGEQGWSMEHGVTPHAYAAAAVQWREAGADIIGGCCGTGPEHIRALAQQLKKCGIS